MSVSSESPCDLACELNEYKYCNSCFRSEYEICNWKMLEQKEKNRIMGEITAIKLFLTEEIDITII